MLDIVHNPFNQLVTVEEQSPRCPEMGESGILDKQVDLPPRNTKKCRRFRRGKDWLRLAERILNLAYPGLHLTDGPRIASLQVIQTEGKEIYLIPELRQIPSVNLVSHISNLCFGQPLLHDGSSPRLHPPPRAFRP